MHLAAGRFKRHDRNRFRIHAYPVNRPDAEAARILQDGCDRVTGLDSLDDRAAAAQIRADGVDILVDLSGPNRLMRPGILAWRSEEHTSELQSLLRISYAVFCLKKKTIREKMTTDNEYKQHTI